MKPAHAVTTRVTDCRAQPSWYGMNHVVLLGAGSGTRLRPHTDHRPKCAIDIAGEPLAVRMLRQLAGHGVSAATVVVGHCAERARALLGNRVRGLDVRFVENASYASTNTMYSTLLAIDALADGGFLVEGDIVASDAAIARLCGADPASSHWAAEPWTPAHRGSRLRSDDSGRIVAQDICRTQTAATRWLWKSAGMLRLSRAGARALGAALRGEPDRGLYYDEVIARHLPAFHLAVLDLAGAPWLEIDDADDLAQARRLFEEAA